MVRVGTYDIDILSNAVIVGDRANREVRANPHLSLMTDVLFMILFRTSQSAKVQDMQDQPLD
jgi:hypothetical protein